MPYELIGHTFWKDSVKKLQFFGLEENYPGIFKEWLKNNPSIFDYSTWRNFENFELYFDFVLSTFIKPKQQIWTKSVFGFFHLLNR
jgi:hypothetical protein